MITLPWHAMLYARRFVGPFQVCNPDTILHNATLFSQVNAAYVCGHRPASSRRRVPLPRRLLPLRPRVECDCRRPPRDACKGPERRRLRQGRARRRSRVLRRARPSASSALQDRRRGRRPVSQRRRMERPPHGDKGESRRSQGVPERSTRSAPPPRVAPPPSNQTHAHLNLHLHLRTHNTTHTPPRARAHQHTRHQPLLKWPCLSPSAARERLSSRLDHEKMRTREASEN